MRCAHDGRDDTVALVATRANGEITLCGTFESGITFGGATFTSPGGDTFLLRLDSTGNYETSQAMPGDEAESTARAGTSRKRPMTAITPKPTAATTNKSGTSTTAKTKTATTESTTMGKMSSS